jgi:hypothetical protein
VCVGSLYVDLATACFRLPCRQLHACWCLRAALFFLPQLPDLPVPPPILSAEPVVVIRTAAQAARDAGGGPAAIAFAVAKAKAGLAARGVAVPPSTATSPRGSVAGSDTDDDAVAAPAVAAVGAGVSGVGLEPEDGGSRRASAQQPQGAAAAAGTAAAAGVSGASTSRGSPGSHVVSVGRAGSPGLPEAPTVPAASSTDHDVDDAMGGVDGADSVASVVSVASMVGGDAGGGKPKAPTSHLKQYVEGDPVVPLKPVSSLIPEVGAGCLGTDVGHPLPLAVPLATPHSPRNTPFPSRRPIPLAAPHSPCDAPFPSQHPIPHSTAVARARCAPSPPRACDRRMPIAAC